MFVEIIVKGLIHMSVSARIWIKRNNSKQGTNTQQCLEVMAGGNYENVTLHEFTVHRDWRQNSGQ